MPLRKNSAANAGGRSHQQGDKPELEFGWGLGAHHLPALFASLPNGLGLRAIGSGAAFDKRAGPF